MAFPGPESCHRLQVFQSYNLHRDDPGTPNNTLEDPLVPDLLGEIRGLDFLDPGCGAAVFGKQLLAAGAASCPGVDGSRNMIGQAEPRTCQAPAGQCRAHVL